MKVKGKGKPTRMPETSKLHQFGAHQKALALFDLVVGDLAILSREPSCQRLVSRQIASADSIAANIEKGYGRGSKTRLPPLPHHCPRFRPGNPRPLWSPEALACSRFERATVCVMRRNHRHSHGHNQSLERASKDLDQSSPAPFTLTFTFTLTLTFP